MQQQSHQHLPSLAVAFSVNWWGGQAFYWSTTIEARPSSSGRDRFGQSLSSSGGGRPHPDQFPAESVCKAGSQAWADSSLHSPPVFSDLIGFSGFQFFAMQRQAASVRSGLPAPVTSSGNDVNGASRPSISNPAVRHNQTGLSPTQPGEFCCRLHVCIVAMLSRVIDVEWIIEASPPSRLAHVSFPSVCRFGNWQPKLERDADNQQPSRS